MLLASQTSCGDLTCDHSSDLVLAMCILGACTASGTPAVQACEAHLCLDCICREIYWCPLGWVAPCN